MEFCSEVTTPAFVIDVDSAVGVPPDADFSAAPDFLPVCRETEWNGLRDIEKARFNLDPFPCCCCCCWPLQMMVVAAVAEELLVVFSLLPPLLLLFFVFSIFTNDAVSDEAHYAFSHHQLSCAPAQGQQTADT